MPSSLTRQTLGNLAYSIPLRWLPWR